MTGERPLAVSPFAEAIAGRAAEVRRRIAAACARAGRDPDEVTLIAVTKTHPIETVRAAIAAGLLDLGENRVQEGAAKVEALRAAGEPARWHLIGHLQTNKARSAIEHFDILHGVDSERAARAISDRAERPVQVLIEVNVSGESSKFGVDVAAAAATCERVGALPRIDLIGLMTVAPLADDPDDVRPIFQRLRQLGLATGLRGLSMGMTDDFEVAVEEGATMVRIGRALFGDRSAPV